MEERKKIALVEVWIGKIPEYFSYHIETIRSLTSVDFYFFSNDKEYDFGSIDHKNFHFNYITEEEFLERFNKNSEIKIDKITSPKKIIDFKLSYFEMFSDYVSSYPYVGIYDIDTLFGDLNDTLLESLEKYDFISVGDEIFHNRLSGPLLIMRNSREILDLLKSDRYYETLLSSDIYGYGEQELSKIALDNYSVKIIYSMNTDSNNGGKNIYDAYWSGGKLFVEGKEKMIYHFYRKNETRISKIGNLINANYNKILVEDFYWVVSFTKSYEPLFVNMIESIKKYSNRKCIIYSINYDYSLSKYDLSRDQFIVRRIDIAEGDKDSRGRDNNIISSKPLINLDVIKSFPNKKYVCIDSDIYFTVNSDSIKKYFNNLENYPLINSHIHDVFYVSNIVEGEEWSSPLGILKNSMEIAGEIFPRRKTNVMIFDERSKWFFEEQMEIYQKYKNSKPGILTFHDEDTANAILTKYNLLGCLPLLDIEEVNDIDMNIFENYSYNLTPISPSVVLPSGENDVLFFHGIKSQDHYKNIIESYGKKVIDCEEFVVTYSKNTLLFEKNSFMTTKKVNETVDFIIMDLEGNHLYALQNQKIYNYWYFYISDIILDPKKYLIRIEESDSRRCIFSDILEVR